MICKSCGATVKEGQFTCSSCGAYLSKDTTVGDSSVEAKIAITGSNRSSSSSQMPVVVSYGWKWYAFMTYGIIPVWSISNLCYVIKGLNTSFMLGLIYLSIAICGYITHKKLVDFSSSALPFLYVLSFSPLYILIYTYAKIKKEYGDYIDVGKLFTKNGTIMAVIVGTIVLAIINIVYFQNRKNEFTYY